MIALLGIGFIAIVIAILAIGTALDPSSSRGRVLRNRLRAVESAARRGSAAEVAVLRDELLSGIPALNKLLSRWSRSSRLQLLLEQAALKLRPGKFLLISTCTGAAGASITFAFSSLLSLSLVGFVGGAFFPLAYVFFLRRRRFKKFEEMF